MLEYFFLVSLRIYPYKRSVHLKYSPCSSVGLAPRKPSRATADLLAPCPAPVLTRLPSAHCTYLPVTSCSQGSFLRNIFFFGSPSASTGWLKPTGTAVCIWLKHLTEHMNEGDCITWGGGKGHTETPAETLTCKLSVAAQACDINTQDRWQDTEV